MKAAVLHAVGKLPRFEDVPEPEAGEGQELVRVTACPLTNFDRALAAGTHYSRPARLPSICGTIAAGTLPDGSRVIFGSADVTMAERAATRAQWCSPIPDGLDGAVAAAAQNPGSQPGWRWNGGQSCSPAKAF